MYIYHALINALSAHIMHINLKQSLVVQSNSTQTAAQENVGEKEEKNPPKRTSCYDINSLQNDKVLHSMEKGKEDRGSEVCVCVGGGGGDENKNESKLE